MAEDVSDRSKTSTTPQKSTTKSFLELPPELRNSIYEHHAALTTLKVNRGLCVPPPLTQVCRQIRKEFGSFLDDDFFASASFEIRVRDWDFRPVINFINKLKQYDKGQVKNLLIHIDVFTPAANYSPGRADW